MNLKICDKCETIIKPGQYERTNEKTVLGIFTLDDRPVHVTVVVGMTIQDPEYGAQLSGFTKPIIPKELCRACFKKLILQALNAYCEPPTATIALATPDK